MNVLTTLPLAALAVFALNVIFSVTTICLITLLAARFPFRHHPALRYAVCLTGLLSALCIPLAVGFLGKAGGGLTILSLPEYFSAPVLAVMSASPLSSGHAAMPIPHQQTPLFNQGIAAGIGAAALVWAMGILWGIGRFAQGWKIASRLTDGARLWNMSLPTEIQTAAERLINGPLPPIYIAPRVASPVAVGLFRPLILLPDNLAETLSPVQLRQILLHEYAHIAFRHAWGGIAERIVRALYWPHPLAHALCRELARAREEVCDNVASQETGTACYARTLLAIAQGIILVPNQTSALALLGPETCLENRIAGLLHPRRNRMTAVKRKQLWGVAGAAALAIGMTTTIRLVSAADKTKGDTIASFDRPDPFWLKRLAEAKGKKAKESAWRPAAQSVLVLDRPEPKAERVVSPSRLRRTILVERVEIPLTRVSGEALRFNAKGELRTARLLLTASPPSKSALRPAPKARMLRLNINVDSKAKAERLSLKAQGERFEAQGERLAAQSAKQAAEAKAQGDQSAKQEAEAAKQKADSAKQQAEAVKQQAEAAKQEAERAKTAD